jgi:phage baseplate assembly protein W
MTTSIIYSDIPTNLDVHPVKEDLVLLTNEAAVKRSIRNLILTDPYERPFNSTIGSGIRQSLFENIGQDTEYILTEKIKETIINYEPRANLVNISVKLLPDDNSYSATIVFSVLNSLTPITLDLILRRVR